MMINAMLMLLFIYWIRKGGVGTGKIRYKTNTANNTTSKGEIECIDGNFNDIYNIKRIYIYLRVVLSKVINIFSENIE